MRKTISLTVACLMMLAFARTVGAADKLSAEDKDTIKDAMRNLQAVAAECRLARDHTKNDRVQSMASKILGGDDKMIEQIHDLRKKYDMEFDTSPTNPDRKDRRALDKLEGKEFDREFVDTMVQQHEELLRIFKNGAKSENSDVREWFDKKQEAIREHLDMAKRMQKDLKE
jgi:putative membrane protein